MNPPYNECLSCVATAWCKRYKGEAPIPETPAWCNPKYRLDRAIKLSNMPKRYINANYYSYKVNENNRRIAATLKPYLLDIVKTVEDGKNFLFRGFVPGTGKTFNASMLMNQYIYKTCLTARMDFEKPLGYFINYADLMDELRYNKDDEGLEQVLENVKNVPVLLLDDIGSGTTSNFTNEQTYIILNYRYNKGLSTIFTTNLDEEDLVGALNPRIVSRIKNNCVEIEFFGSDLRAKG